METRMSPTGAGPAAGITIAELPPATRIVLRTAAPDEAEGALGLPLAGRIGTRAAADGRSALRLGPDEWLLEAPAADARALARILADLAARMPLSAVDVSDREVTWRLEGPAVLDLLATGCPRDLARLPVGSGARSVFDTVQVVIAREGEDRFHLTAWRSFAPHVRALLDLAAREIAAGL
jgi:sarcosine oxidase subunit gamma